ncbi:MAG TPA: OsmC family protein [Gaiellaceae bacterium]|nr:OsmC family protein [Gaiellaceae bacterium]
MTVRSKEFRYAIDLREGGEIRTEDGTALAVDAAWTPEHLLLAALVRCSLESFSYHARRRSIRLEGATGTARAVVTRRESDGRYAVTECELDLDLHVVPLPGELELAELIGLAERDCFIGASLTVKPLYVWTTN